MLLLATRQNGFAMPSVIRSRAGCAELTQLRNDAATAVREAKKTRRSRDVSIQEDAELSREVQRRVYTLIKHLLVGHDGQPCPAGDRPIVSAEAPSADVETPRDFFPQPAHAGKS